MGLYISRLLSHFLGLKDVRIAMVGLDAAGKTTTLYKLKIGETVATIPTLGFNVETVQYKNITFTIWDVGGQEKIRRLWHHYFQGLDGLIYVVDSADRERMETACTELHRVMSEPDLQTAKLLVFANKQDLPGAMRPAEVAEALQLRNLRQEWYIIGSIAANGEGLTEGLDWLGEAVKRKRTQQAS